MKLRLVAPGTTPEERAKGEQAATQVFSTAGIDAYTALQAFLELDRLQLAQAQNEAPSPAMARAAFIWRLAKNAAVGACYGALHQSPASAFAELIVAE